LTVNKELQTKQTTDIRAFSGERCEEMHITRGWWRDSYPLWADL